jgi:glutamate dehydrogenase/leucine dehydrogenase
VLRLSEVMTMRAAAAGLDLGGGKAAILGRFSVLVLNKEVVDRHDRVWTVDDTLSIGRGYWRIA